MLPEQGGPGVANELYNVERIARSEVLTRLLADYSQLPPELSPDAPRLGEPLPGGGAPILRAEQQADGKDAQRSVFEARHAG